MQFPKKTIQELLPKSFISTRKEEKSFILPPNTDCMFNLWSAMENFADFAEFREGKE